MKRETFKKQIAELFPGEKINIVWVEEKTEAKIKINRELTRLELGHFFSLGMQEIKSLEDGLFISFDLNKAMLNIIYQNEITK